MIGVSYCWESLDLNYNQMRQYKVHCSKYGYYLIRYPNRKKQNTTLRSYYWTWEKREPRIAKAKVYKTQEEAEIQRNKFLFLYA